MCHSASLSRTLWRVCMMKRAVLRRCRGRDEVCVSVVLCCVRREKAWHHIYPHLKAEASRVRSV